VRQAGQDDLRDAAVLVDVRGAEVAAQDATHVDEVLLPGGLVEVVLGVEIGDHLWRERLLTIPRPTRRDVHQGKGDDRDEQQDRHEP
jgi:hypothetical protein